MIDRYGISMAEEKIRKAADFPLPSLGKHLKQFMGLANYFRDHIENFGAMAHPLDKLLNDYKDIKNGKYREIKIQKLGEV